MKQQEAAESSKRLQKAAGASSTQQQPAISSRQQNHAACSGRKSGEIPPTSGPQLFTDGFHFSHSAVAAADSSSTLEAHCLTSFALVQCFATSKA